MSASFIASVSNANDTSGTTLDAGTTLNIASGDILVTWCKWEGADTTLSVASSGGTNSHSLGTKVNHGNSDLNGQFAYVTAATADATMTVRMTLAASRPYRRFITMQFRPDAGDTVSLDTQNTGSGSSAAPASGAITTTGTDEIVVGGYGEYAAATTSSEQINGVAATEPAASPQSFTSTWYRLVTSTFAGGTASATISSNAWICNVIAIKSEGAGATGGGPLVGSGPLVRGSLIGSGRLVLS